MGRLPKFTAEELSQYDGQNGSPAYVAYDGKVYDISHSFLWAEGDHQMSHYAGENLTHAFGRAPHTFEETLAAFPVVGVFIED
ncbi:cytochrome B5 [candidate division KSB3 bacterium]|uniref:Cytochrome B5 n=1 Tax=candidate division KSB3 bacterium TaxID=2044937 RepID=A0A9D5Q6A3_9BACT|nr:cytochrome B5 [candidate division KSB3 bacterium]MBD3325515.1 cytochrome B5 [candidate division KSB3 bacterium]